MHAAVSEFIARSRLTWAWAGRAAAALVLLYGLAACVSWPLELTPVIQLAPRYGTVQFNTGLGLALCGLALLCVGSGRARWARCSSAARGTCR